MSISLSSKLFKLFFFLSVILLLSCEKTQNKVAIRAGDRIWTFQEVQKYFQLRANKIFSSESYTITRLKEEIIREIFLRSVVENWAKKNKIPKAFPVFSKEEKFRLSKKNLSALRDHKSYLSIYNSLLNKLSKNVPMPSLKEQKSFYNKNKALFIEPASCHLKQIVVDKKNLASSIYQRLSDGENFNNLNKLYSLKKSPGWIKRGELEVFDKVCFENKKTGLSSIINSPYGYHIFFVGKRKPAKETSFKQAKKQIIPFLKAKKTKVQFQKWLKKELAQTLLWVDKNLLEKIHIQYKTKPI